VHQPCTASRGLTGNRARRLSVQQSGQFRLALGLVHGCVRRGIDDDFRPQSTHRFSHGLRSAEVSSKFGAVVVDGHEFAEGLQRALQLPAHLARLAEKQHLH